PGWRRWLASGTHSRDHAGMLSLSRGAFLAAVAVIVTTGKSTSAAEDRFRAYYGPRYAPLHVITRNHGPQRQLDSVHPWNEIAINATGLDHTPVAPGENRVFGEQLGPTRASRAMAIVHIAIFDSVNAVLGGSNGYTNARAPHGPVSLEAAVAQ